MRFIGNKESITNEIFGLLEQKGLLNKNLALFDAFCGSGSVADALKGSFNIIINDLLNWCVVYTKGRILAADCNFDRLGFDPFEFFNNSDETVKGFIYYNYAPTNSERMYFTPENAGRIDYFRQQIEEWNRQQLLTEEEYAYLLACLIESVSDVANTAGVYGAFLKKWDPRAIKPIVFNKVDSNSERHNLVGEYNGEIEEIIADIPCDVLYLDPPYTQNQYGTQYHLLETLVLDDNPSISPITGSRSTAPMRSDWSKEYKANIKFDFVIANTQAKYILFSYNNDGFMSKEYIEACLKRYGKPETYICKNIQYKKYRNFKTKSGKEHFEYLFFVEKRETKDICYESPLNYIGSKAKMITDIKRNLPNDIEEFYDVFGGGFNVGINIGASRVIYNDINFFVKELVESFQKYDTYDYLLYIRQITKKFGLEKANAENYFKARDYYNSLPMNKRDPRLLYTIILYGYQQQIRFNGDHNFNNPVGMRWFNDKVLEKMISFSRVIKSGNYTFGCQDFTDALKEINPNVFVYMDPPYRLTRGSYNDGKRGFSGWTIKHEQKLLESADNLNLAGTRFMISYVVEHGRKINTHISNWIEKMGYKLIAVDGIPGRERKEVLIINYEKEQKEQKEQNQAKETQLYLPFIPTVAPNVL
jgi:adenine-specific DNA-methyltransferase